MNSYGSGQGGDGERAWNRARAVAWDDRWHRLSVAARRAFLEQTKGPSKSTTVNRVSFSTGLIDADVLDELARAGFVEREKGAGAKIARAVVPDDLFDFALRVRAIHRYHVLGPQGFEGVLKFCRNCFQNNGELAIRRILQAAQVHDSGRLEQLLDHYVSSHHWPVWTVQDAGTPLAEALADALILADSPTPLARLPRVLSRPAAECEAALWALVQRLTVFEDLDPKTLDIVVDFLPVVRERLVEATRPRERPPLVEVAQPRELGPHSGLLGGDLRVFLLEVIAQAPRLRQDRRLFAKEEPRFLAALPAWPEWLVQMANATPEARLDQAYEWAVRLGFVDRSPADDDQNRLVLTTKGQAWMACDVEDQYRLIYDHLRAFSTKPGTSSYYSYSEPTHADALFLGVAAVVRPGKRSSYWSEYDAVKPEDRQALRDAIDRALGELPLGRYVTVESALAHLAFEQHNPLTLGKQDISGLAIAVAHARVPSLAERVEPAGRDLLRTFLVRRLLPFDALRVAISDDGHLCVARTPRLDGYFGRKYRPLDPAGSGNARVIVQPDFSVMVIGLDPAPAVALSPFCDRHQGQAGQGAMILKLTRESVVRAVAAGMKPAEIVARLVRHASVAVPANVLAEVREWAGWTRLVNVRPFTAIRCPDRATVARVVAALGRRAEALGDTLVGLEADKLTAAERAKLQAHGIIITRADITVAPAEPEPEPEPEPAPEPAAGAKPKVRRGRPRKVR